MKIRTGFVSNSSSSSFVCQVCGETYSGWDATLTDAEMESCDKGHLYCASHRKKDLLIEEFVIYLKERASNEKLSEYTKKEAKETLEEIEKSNEETQKDIMNDWIHDNSTPYVFCPLCNCEEINEEEAYRAIKEMKQMSIEEITLLIKEYRKKKEDQKK
jgi:hypothetical protein